MYSIDPVKVIDDRDEYNKRIIILTLSEMRI